MGLRRATDNTQEGPRERWVQNMGLRPGPSLRTPKAYKDYISQSKTIEEANAKKYEYFSEKTKELFSDKFEGFEFSIGDQSLVFKPGETKDIMNVQSDVNNFISKYLDENGKIKDTKGYHKALSAALNPDKLASYFYEKGKADAVVNASKKSKNIDMSVRSTPVQAKSKSKSGIQFRAVGSQGSGNGLKIRKK